MNGKNAVKEFYEQQLFEAKSALFSATSVREEGGRAAAVPWSFREVALAVAEHREAFEAGGVFPAPLLDRLVSDLAHI